MRGSGSRSGRPGVARAFRVPWLALGFAATFTTIVPDDRSADARIHSAAETTIEGIVRFTGNPVPEPTQVANTTDPEVCGESKSLEDLLVDPETRGVANVIVSLVGVPSDAVPERPPVRVTLDNRNCRFVPHALVVTTGDTIVAGNSDEVLHTVHYYGPLRGNLSLPRAGVRASRVARSPGFIAVKCDVHGWMQAFIRVDPHPYHAVAGQDGRFVIRGVPAGTYTLEAWHERLGRREAAVTVAAGGATVLEVEYTGQEEGEKAPPVANASRSGGALPE